jgi:hypothetical protein
MRWEHIAGFSLVVGILGGLWRWLDRHLKSIHAKFNGYTLEKKEKK